jgi:predicted DCC family thiol-disulfide oxidoreductase YuxK
MKAKWDPRYSQSTSMNKEDIKQEKVILFDGVCNLCNSSVSFILKQERRPIFKFASIQSEAGRELLKGYGLPVDYAQTVILIDNGNMFLGSTAALKIGQTLKLPWSLLACVGFMVPELVRDWVYNQIAVNRYQWFGKRDVCMIPTEKLKARFL